MKIILNKIRCNICDEEIESKSTHDFKFCKCKSVAIAGGLEYLKRSCLEHGHFTELSITDSE
ncbi:MAG: hypothetical protein RSD13_06040 [Clostridium sp.]